MLSHVNVLHKSDVKHLRLPISTDDNSILPDKFNKFYVPETNEENVVYNKVLPHGRKKKVDHGRPHKRKHKRKLSNVSCCLILLQD